MHRPRRRLLGIAGLSDVLYYTLIPSPLGALWLAATPRGLCRLGFHLGEGEWIERVTRETGIIPRRADRFFDAARRQLGEYFAGSRRAFDLPLDLAHGSPFQRRVWEAALCIPYGQVCSYSALARAISAERAARAVGGALGANPLPIIIPCHRVARADGSLGGYTGGLEIKRALLRLEGYVYA